MLFDNITQLAPQGCPFDKAGFTYIHAASTFLKLDLLWHGELLLSTPFYRHRSACRQ